MAPLSKPLELPAASARPMRTAEGIVIRVNYQSRQLVVLVDERRWFCEAGPQCVYWIDGRRALLRCVHPHDFVRIHYRCLQDQNLAEEIHMGEAPTAAPADWLRPEQLA